MGMIAAQPGLPALVKIFHIDAIMRTANATHTITPTIPRPAPSGETPVVVVDSCNNASVNRELISFSFFFPRFVDESVRRYTGLRRGAMTVNRRSHRVRRESRESSETEAIPPLRSTRSAPESEIRRRREGAQSGLPLRARLPADAAVPRGCLRRVSAARSLSSARVVSIETHES